MKYIAPNAAPMNASTSSDASSLPAGRCWYVNHTSIATMRINPIHTTMYGFMPAFCRASVMACPFRSGSSSAYVHQIHERKHEHLNQSDKMPVQGGRLDMAGVEAIAVESDGDDSDRDHTANHVEQ